MKLFWTDIWERDGVYSRNQRDLKKWRKAVKRRISMGATTDSTMDLDRSQAWRATVLHQANWRAPGPDGIHAYWLKTFPTTTEAVMNECWKVADGESDCQAG